MKLAYLLFTISLISTRCLSDSMAQSSLNFHNAVLERIAKIDYEDDPNSYRKLTLAEMARDFAAFEDSDEENDRDENYRVMTSRLAKKRKDDHGSHSHARDHKSREQRGHSHTHKKKGARQSRHPHEYQHKDSHEHGHHHHHGGGYHHGGKRSHLRELTGRTTRATMSAITIPTPATRRSLSTLPLSKTTSAAKITKMTVKKEQ